MTKFDLFILSLTVLATVLLVFGIVEAWLGVRGAKRQQEHEQPQQQYTYGPGYEYVYLRVAARQGWRRRRDFRAWEEKWEWTEVPFEVRMKRMTRTIRAGQVSIERITASLQKMMRAMKYYYGFLPDGTEPEMR